MSDSPNFAKLVPGFEFLQGLMKNAGNSLPNMGQWIAPTIDPEELEKRIEQLKTVQFWLEQNTRMISASIQALEVQRMTLSTLKTMNLPMADLRDALKIHVPTAAAPAPAPRPNPAHAPTPAPARANSTKAAAPADGAAGAVDPMQWWGALTKQFGDLATQAVQDMAKEAAKAAPRAAATAKPSSSRAADAPTAKDAAKTAAKKARKPATRRPPAR